MTSFTIVTRSTEDTFLAGRLLGLRLEPGDFIALEGDLGAGKTQFTKGVAAGLGVGPTTTVTSPTYTLLNSYHGRIVLHHFDLYRLHGDEDVADLGFPELFYSHGVSVVEWSDRLHDELPQDRLSVSFSHEGVDQRRLEFTAYGARYEVLLDDLRAELKLMHLQG